MQSIERMPALLYVSIIIAMCLEECVPGRKIYGQAILIYGQAFSVSKANELRSSLVEQGALLVDHEYHLGGGLIIDLMTFYSLLHLEP